jgi:hypothetical protein
MNSEQKQASVTETEMTPNNVLADGWRLTRAILALKDMDIPDTIEFQIDGASHIRATRVATLDELATALAALNEAIEHRSGDKPNATTLHGHLEVEELNKQRDALEELHKRVGQRAEREHWLEIRKKEALRIDPETAEVAWSYAQVLDPYGVLDKWELPEECDCVGRAYFARAPGSDIWVEFGDLPQETRDKLWNRHRRKLAFPAGLEGPGDGPEIPF